ncbi:MAG TPA: HNH endonuclease [Patescibacteria group bacterium]|nr:HNH endonuclease [Patescibacteria group bacterium]
MTKRIGLSKSIRFEVLKRDKFICQYCGGKAPTVILQIDHIEPVAKGGSNDITNLITSCFDCNSGKKDRKLSDDSVVEKHRKQLELLQERREQIEFMFQWKKSLSKLDTESVRMIKAYTDSKIEPLSISENGEKTIRGWLRKYSIDQVLDAIDLAEEKYLKVSNDGEITKESVENFFDKIGGILYNQSLTPIQQKIAHIKRIAIKRFGDEDSKIRRATIALNYYVKALKDNGYSDEEVLKDLEEELLLKEFEADFWSQWIDVLEGWTKNLTNKKNEQPQRGKHEYNYETLEQHVKFTLYDIEGKMKVLLYIGNRFPTFNERDFQNALYTKLIEYLTFQEQLNDTQFEEYRDENTKLGLIIDYAIEKSITQYFGYDEDSEEHSFYNELYNVATDILTQIFESFYYPATNYAIIDIKTQITILKNILHTDMSQ